VRSRIGLGILMAILVVATAASAQVPAVPGSAAAGSWEIGGGVAWVGSFTGPSTVAELTRNGQLSGGLDLFTADSEVSNGAAFDASLALYVTRTIALEGGFRYSKPILSYDLAGDFENAAPVSAEETLARYVFTGSLVWHFRPLTVDSRFVPFVAGGGGYIRDLHQGNELVETGGEFHAVGGVKYWLGTGRRKFGLRGEAGVSVVNGGFDFRDTSRTLPVVSASLLYLF
jgi:hypothetical protein